MGAPMTIQYKQVYPENWPKFGWSNTRHQVLDGVPESWRAQAT